MVRKYLQSNQLLRQGHQIMRSWSIRFSNFSQLDSKGNKRLTKGTHLAVGTNKGLVQLWDVNRTKKVRQFSGHRARIGFEIIKKGSIAWNESTLTSGSRDRVIYNRDVRDSNDYSTKLVGHKQEVCGLKWNPEGSLLASGGNDNKLLIWDSRNTKPIAKFNEHVAAGLVDY